MFSCRSSSTSLPFSCSISNCGRWEWFGHYFPPLAGYLRPLPPHSAPSARIMGAAWLRIIDQQRIFLLTPLRPWNSEPFSRNPTKNGRHFKSFQFARAKRCPASVLFGSRATFGYGHLLTLYLVILVLTFSSVNVLFRLVCIWIGWELFHLGPRPLLVTFVIYGTQRTALFNVPGNAPASCSSIFLFFFFKKENWLWFWLRRWLFHSQPSSLITIFPIKCENFSLKFWLRPPFCSWNQFWFHSFPTFTFYFVFFLPFFFFFFFFFFTLQILQNLRKNRTERRGRLGSDALSKQRQSNTKNSLIMKVKKKTYKGPQKKNKRKVNERHKKMKQMKQNNKRKKTTTITDDDDDDKLPRSTALTCIFFHL